MELFEKYKQEIASELIINEFNIKEVQLKLPSRKHFWAARLIDNKIKQQSLYKKKKKIKQEIVRKIISESPVKITNVTAETAAENSAELQKINDEIKECDYIIEYLEKVEKVFSSMHWEIKNIIEINKLEQL